MDGICEDNHVAWHNWYSQVTDNTSQVTSLKWFVSNDVLLSNKISMMDVDYSVFFNMPVTIFFLHFAYPEQWQNMLNNYFIYISR